MCTQVIPLLNLVMREEPGLRYEKVKVLVWFKLTAIFAVQHMQMASLHDVHYHIFTLQYSNPHFNTVQQSWLVVYVWALRLST